VLPFSTITSRQADAPIFDERLQLLILGRRHLQHTLDAYTSHYNTQRPHRALELLPPIQPPDLASADLDRIERQDILGGLIHEYHPAA
jgi:putative transposase